MRASFKSPLLLCACLAFLSGCAGLHAETSSHFFNVDHVEKAELDKIVDEIKTKSQGSITILVKYHWIEPYAGNLQLAQNQATTLKTYLTDHGVTNPIDIETTPRPQPVNQVWISYSIK
jgi:hypothetical protein